MYPVIRDLELNDIFHKEGLTDCLNQIAPCELSKKSIEELYFDRQYAGMRTLVAILGHTIVGTGTLVIEQKFIHNGGKVGHIEDVAVLPEYHRHGIGRSIVKTLIQIARNNECYKVILTCSNDNYEFYRKLGFHKYQNAMRIDL